MVHPFTIPLVCRPVDVKTGRPPLAFAGLLAADLLPAGRLAASVLAALAVMISDAAAQDAEHGRQVFSICAPCHVADADTNKLGPHLQGVVGRKAGSVAEFRYSQAMRDAGAAGLFWDEAALSAFLSSPKRKVPGTSMRFWGFWSQSEIDDVIAYLKDNS